MFIKKNKKIKKSAQTCSERYKCRLFIWYVSKCKQDYQKLLVVLRVQNFDLTPIVRY